MARMAAPFLKVPILPVRGGVPAGKITTDQPWLRCSLRRSSAGRAPPARGMGKVLIKSSVSIASHFRLKIESAAATTNARKRKRLGSACNITTASSALLWLETKIAPPLMVLTRYRSITVRGEKAHINGKMMKVCRMARAPRTVRARGQDGSLTGGWLVVSTFLPSGGPPAKVGAGADAGTSQAYLMARPLRATENVSAEISRNLALELVRVTEAGALGNGRRRGRGGKNTAHRAGVDAVRRGGGAGPRGGAGGACGGGGRQGARG